MNVCVIGTGYVGIETGVCLAQLGHDVICLDNNTEKVVQMQAERSLIYEPRLDELMQDAMVSGQLRFTTDLTAIDWVGADATQVSLGMGWDSRIGSKFLQSGIGWGGSCFPKDVAALIHTAQDYDYEAPVLNTVVQTNRYQRTLALEKLQQTIKTLKGKSIELLGLIFKPNTNDMLDSLALNLIQNLHWLGAKIKVYVPFFNPSRHQILWRMSQ